MLKSATSTIASHQRIVEVTRGYPLCVQPPRTPQQLTLRAREHVHTTSRASLSAPARPTCHAHLPMQDTHMARPNPVEQRLYGSYPAPNITTEYRNGYNVAPKPGDNVALVFQVRWVTSHGRIARSRVHSQVHDPLWLEHRKHVASCCDTSGEQKTQSVHMSVLNPLACTLGCMFQSAARPQLHAACSFASSSTCAAQQRTHSVRACRKRHACIQSSRRMASFPCSAHLRAKRTRCVD